MTCRNRQSTVSFYYANPTDTLRICHKGMLYTFLGVHNCQSVFVVDQSGSRTRRASQWVSLAAWPLHRLNERTGLFVRDVKPPLRGRHRDHFIEIGPRVPISHFRARHFFKQPPGQLSGLLSNDKLSQPELYRFRQVIHLSIY